MCEKNPNHIVSQVFLDTLHSVCEKSHFHQVIIIKILSLITVCDPNLHLQMIRKQRGKSRFPVGQLSVFDSNFTDLIRRLLRVGAIMSHQRGVQAPGLPQSPLGDNFGAQRARENAA